ncbi:hypothetical protein COLO4_32161 [Corchorus olitorius]|uniref:Uncharacterized protein n=1 Tax=Corchorus olitorius TaxID=93759 RepID=A0A1R3H0R4_9ROSI|nr:hypothetical protein COLO4_32161 [Corchorus olitorius]
MSVCNVSFLGEECEECVLAGFGLEIQGPFWCVSMEERKGSRGVKNVRS